MTNKNELHELHELYGLHKFEQIDGIGVGRFLIAFNLPRLQIAGPTSCMAVQNILYGRRIHQRVVQDFNLSYILRRKYEENL